MPKADIDHPAMLARLTTCQPLTRAIRNPDQVLLKQ
jgi:hypothetical protein